MLAHDMNRARDRAVFTFDFSKAHLVTDLQLVKIKIDNTVTSEPDRSPVRSLDDAVVKWSNSNGHPC